MPSIQTWRNNLGIRIPSALPNQLAVKSGTEVDLSVSNGALLVKPVAVSEVARSRSRSEASTRQFVFAVSASSSPQSSRALMASMVAM